MGDHGTGECGQLGQESLPAPILPPLIAIEGATDRRGVIARVFSNSFVSRMMSVARLWLKNISLSGEGVVVPLAGHTQPRISSKVPLVDRRKSEL